MIIVTATCWPGGNAAGSYELLHATITNRSSPEDKTDSYMAHVLARPDYSRGLNGYEADVEVKGHKFADGFAPLLMSVLNGAHGSDGRAIVLPSARARARVDLMTAVEFEKVLRGRQ